MTDQNQINIPDEKIIYEGDNSIVYYYESSKWNYPVVIKVIKDDYSFTGKTSLFQNEYNILQNIDIKGVQKLLGKTIVNGKQALIFKHINGITLKQYLKDSKTISSFLSLEIALAFSRILFNLYQKKIIHHNINPENILFYPENNDLHLIDFEFATRDASEIRFDKIKTSLPYLSPEQTGKINKFIDYRTDLYSFGVVLYELSTGQLPFYSNDTLEMIHMHIAKEPVKPSSINHEIPEIFSKIILKLLAKSAEDRYQSILGLMSDLEKCYRHLKQKSFSTVFEIGRSDYVNNFSISEKLYSRDKDFAALLDCFDRVQNGRPEIILISGEAGTGKTSLINKFGKTVLDSNSIFIKGKFDKLQKNIPYSAISKAFEELIALILTESDEKFASWKRTILNSTGKYGKILTELIPGLELITGDNDFNNDLNVLESGNRFNYIFIEFVKAIAQKDQTIVLFLDDIQWIDDGSLNLMTKLNQSLTNEKLLIIGAYRDNEINQYHPLHETITNINNNKIKNVSLINLENLSIHDLKSLLIDSLKTHKNVSKFCKLLFEKTYGNPLHVKRLLMVLAEDGQITYNEKRKKWICNISAIQKLNITENVVDLLTNRIKELNFETRHILKIASCIGNRFTLSTLYGITTNPHYVIENAINDAQKGQFISEIDKDYFFSHDKIHQAVYDLLEERQKKEFHLKIGFMMLENIDLKRLSEQLFEIVDHLNLGISLVINQYDNNKITRLNLLAGQKAKSTLAYQASCNYLQNGIKILGKDAWEKQYDLMLAMHNNLAESLFLVGDYNQTNEIVEILENNAKNDLDKHKAYEIKILIYSANNQMKLAFDTGFEVIKKLDIIIKDSPPYNCNIEQFENLPSMTAPDKLAAFKIIRIIIPPAILINSPMLNKLVYTMLDLCLNYGNCPYSPFAYISYGWLLCGHLEEIETGYEFGRLALRMLEKYESSHIDSQVKAIFDNYIRHWKEHTKNTMVSFPKIIKESLEAGDINFACYEALIYCVKILYLENRLENAHNINIEYINLIKKYKQKFHLNVSSISAQMIDNLMGKTKNVLILQGEFFDEFNMIPFFKNNNDSLALFCCYNSKAIINYIFQKYDDAIINSLMADDYKYSARGFFIYSIHNFFCSLSMLAQYPMSDPELKEEFINKIEDNQRIMKEWANHAPMNFQYKYDLIEAEKNRVLARRWEACDHYEWAIQSAKHNAYLLDKALIYELAGKFYFTLGRDEIGNLYLEKAYICYVNWGAAGKALQLESQYSFLLKKNSEVEKKSETGISAKNLDLRSIIKASQVVSSNTNLEKLLKDIMQIVLENSGGNKVILVLNQNENFFIRAFGDYLSKQYSVFLNDDDKDLPININLKLCNNKLVPEIIIRYCIRSKELLVIEDVNKDIRFFKDAYFERNKVKSVLCMPLLYHGKLNGIIYIENSEITNCFSIQRVEILKVLAVQFNISIENALLYDNLNRQIKDKSNLLAQVKYSKEQVIKSEQFLKSTLNALSSHIAILDQNGFIIDVNKSWIDYGEQNGLEWEDHGIGKNYLEVLNSVKGNDTELAQEIAQNIKDLIQGKNEIYIKQYACHWNEKKVWFLMRVTRFSSVDGINVVVAHLNITERVIAEQEIIKLNAELEQRVQSRTEELIKTLDNLKATQDHLIQSEKMAALGQLVAGIAHEINTPVGIGVTESSYINRKTKELADELNSGTLKQSFLTKYINNSLESSKSIIANLTRAAQLIQSFKKVAVDHSIDEKINFNLKEYIDQVLISIGPKYKRKGHTINVNCPNDVVLNSYPSAVMQIFTNLIENSIMHGFEDQENGTIAIEIIQQNKKIIITFSDNGKGIDKNELKKIFDPFYTTKRGKGGTGLGLHIVFNLVTQTLKGQINCTSKRKDGTVFQIIVPC